MSRNLGEGKAQRLFFKIVLEKLWKDVFCIWRIRPGAGDYTAVDVTFLTVFFFFLTIFTCKKFPVSAKKVQLLSPASLLSGKTLNYWVKVVWSFS